MKVQYSILFLALGLTLANCKKPSEDAKLNNDGFNETRQKRFAVDMDRYTNPSSHSRYSSDTWTPGEKVHDSQSMKIYEVTSSVKTSNSSYSWYMIVYPNHHRADIELDNLLLSKHGGVEVGKSMVGTVHNAKGQRSIVRNGDRVRFIKRKSIDPNNLFRPGMLMTDAQAARWQDFKKSYAQSSKKIYQEFGAYQTGIELPGTAFWDEEYSSWRLADSEVFANKNALRGHLRGLAQSYPDDDRIKIYARNMQRLLDVPAGQIPGNLVEGSRGFFAGLTETATIHGNLPEVVNHGVVLGGVVYNADGEPILTDLNYAQAGVASACSP